MSTSTDTTVSWFWQWVPTRDGGEALRSEWTWHVVELFTGWAGDQLEAARSAWPPDAPAEFPFTPDTIGGGIASFLLERADELPDWGRLAWGATFVADQLRWAPVLVVVEFHRPEADDPEYLMAHVGARGAEGDAREPTIDYVTTSAGDGVRVSALCRSDEGPVYGRVDAALRLEVLPTAVDVLLSTRVHDLAQMAVIGSGVELLMTMIADEWVTSHTGAAAQGDPS
jgi:hypothetical protein